MTIHELAARIHANQRSKCRRRGHDYPTYTREELEIWLVSQDNFSELFANWERSNYTLDLVPSVDRLDESKTYSFDNIQLITWKENNDKKLTPVVQLTKGGEVVNFFSSAVNASNITGISRGNITSCLLGTRKTAGGFKWITEEIYYGN